MGNPKKLRTGMPKYRESSKNETVNGPKAEELILRLREYFLREKRNKGPLMPLHKIVERVAEALQVSRKLVVRLTNEHLQVTKRDTCVSDLDVKGILLHICEFYTKNPNGMSAELMESLRSQGLYFGNYDTLFMLWQHHLQRVKDKMKKNKTKAFNSETSEIKNETSDSESTPMNKNGTSNTVPIKVYSGPPPQGSQFQQMYEQPGSSNEPIKTPINSGNMHETRSSNKQNKRKQIKKQRLDNKDIDDKINPKSQKISKAEMNIITEIEIKHESEIEDTESLSEHNSINFTSTLDAMVDSCQWYSMLKPPRFRPTDDNEGSDIVSENNPDTSTVNAMDDTSQWYRIMEPGFKTNGRYNTHKKKHRARNETINTERNEMTDRDEQNTSTDSTDTANWHQILEDGLRTNEITAMREDVMENYKSDEGFKTNEKRFKDLQENRSDKEELRNKDKHNSLPETQEQDRNMFGVERDGSNDWNQFTKDMMISDDIFVKTELDYDELFEEQNSFLVS